MIGRIKLLAALFSLFIVPDSAEESNISKQMARENLQKLGLANNEMAFNIYRKLASGNSDNVFFSPFSISTVFGMLFYGTRADTAQELRIALGYEKAYLPTNFVHTTFHRFLSEVIKSDSTNGYILSSANAILADMHAGLLPEYGRNVQELYNASVADVDFSRDGDKIVRAINSWVKRKTNGKIKKIVENISPLTVMILLNAVYFKGLWKNPFLPELTHPGIFYNRGLESEAKEVPFMSKEAKFPYIRKEGFQVLELAYQGDSASMLVLLPDERNGLAALERYMTPERLSSILKDLRNTKVALRLPKFKLEFSSELSSVLRAVGARKIFGAGTADFSGMTRSASMFVSEVIHKSVIEVNEKGSEAASVTMIATNRMLEDIPLFIANHPFLFAIIERGSTSNMILFLGRVNNL